jgi:hypothetical protein
MRSFRINFAVSSLKALFVTTTLLIKSSLLSEVGVRQLVNHGLHPSGLRRVSLAALQKLLGHRDPAFGTPRCPLKVDGRALTCRTPSQAGHIATAGDPFCVWAVALWMPTLRYRTLSEMILGRVCASWRLMTLCEFYAAC